MKLAEACEGDIVIDTNVLSHADNGNAVRHESALDILQWMRGSSVAWVLDDNGKNQPDPWTSVIYSEYQSTLAPQGVALTLFMWCLANDRVVFVSRPSREVALKLESLLPKNKKDRVVLGAACQSGSRVLVTNDEDDFSSRVRRDAKRKLQVLIYGSHEIEP